VNPSTRRKRLVAAGVVATALSVAGTGAAMAANGAKAAPEAAVTEPAPAVEDVTEDEAWLAEVPEGYSPELSASLWAAGYTYEDLEALGALWGIGWMETKTRAGQMLLDGVEIPVAPGSTPVTPFPSEEEAAVFADAGYTPQDAAALGALWGTDSWEAKVRASQALLAGETLPIPPGGSVIP